MGSSVPMHGKSFCEGPKGEISLVREEEYEPGFTLHNQINTQCNVLSFLGALRLIVIRNTAANSAIIITIWLNPNSAVEQVEVTVDIIEDDDAMVDVDDVDVNDDVVDAKFVGV